VQKPKIVLTRRWPDAIEESLAQRYEVRLNTSDQPMTKAQLQQALQWADAVLPTVTDRLDAQVFDCADIRTRLIANYGVGYSHIDTDLAKALGITVTNTPDVVTDCTADLTLTLMLMAARRAGEGERELRANQWTGWRPTHLLGQQVTGKTLGIIGFGRIGKAVAQRAHHGFGMKILVWNRSAVPEHELAKVNAQACDTLQDVLAAMKPSAFLINTARGEVVDDAALIAALQEGRLAGAGLDVYDGEPAINPAYYGLDNAVLLPHLGTATLESREAMGRRVMANVDAFFAGQPPEDLL